MSLVRPVDTELRAGPLDVDGGLGAGVRDGGMLDLVVEEGGAEPREAAFGCRGVHEDVRPTEKIGLVRD